MSAFRMPRPATAFSMDPTRRRRAEVMKDADHLAAIRQLPCCICGTRVNVEAAHLRSPSPAHGKGSTALGQKPSDKFTTPLCADHHRLLPNSQHNMNEMSFWRSHGIDPHTLALALYSCTGEADLMEIVVEATRARARKASS